MMLRCRIFLAVLSSLAEDFDLLEPFLMQQAAHKQHQLATCDLSIVFSDATWLLSHARNSIASRSPSNRPSFWTPARTLE